jgi:hypothetical protein
LMRHTRAFGQRCSPESGYRLTSCFATGKPKVRHLARGPRSIQWLCG